MKKQGTFATVVGLLVVLALIAGCATPPAPAPQAGAPAAATGEPIKIGLISPLTGFAASDGQAALNSANLAIKMVNEAGGINGRPLELVNYDDAGKPDQAASLARKLIEQDKVVAAVSGAYSGPTRAAAPVFQDAGVILVSGYAVHPDITKTGDKIFRTGTLATVQGRVGAELVGNVLKAKKVAILTVDNDFGVSLTAGFKEHIQKLGVEIVFEQKYALGETDFRPLLASIKAANPDVLYDTGYYFDSVRMLAQAQDVGITAQIVGTEGYDSPELVKLAGQAAEGVIITTDLNRDSKEAMAVEYMAEYKKMFNEDANMTGASVFDAVMVLAYAMKTGGVTTEGIAKALMEMRDMHDVATGPFFKYTEGREVVRPVGTQLVKGGKFIFHHEFTDETLVSP
jgi:branched-chain amino acid transport system substrate-binding protein